MSSKPKKSRDELLESRREFAEKQREKKRAERKAKAQKELEGETEGFDVPEPQVIKQGKPLWNDSVKYTKITKFLENNPPTEETEEIEQVETPAEAFNVFQDQAYGELYNMSFNAGQYSELEIKEQQLKYLLANHFANLESPIPLEEASAIINSRPEYRFVVKYRLEGTDYDAGQYDYYTLSQATLNYIGILLEAPNSDIEFSDAVQDFSMQMPYEFEVISMEIPPKQSGSGSFFSYVNASNFDLSRYQIYTEWQLKDKLEDKHCLIHCLELSGINTDSIILNHNYRRANLSKLANELSVNFAVHSVRKNGKTRTDYFPKALPFAKTVELSLYADHYFIYEITKVSIKKFNNNGDGDRMLSSLSLVHKLMENHCFIFSPMLFKTIDFKKAFSFEDVEFKSQQVCPNSSEVPIIDIERQIREPTKSKQYEVFYADTETDTSTGVHKLLLAGLTHKDSTFTFVKTEDEVKLYYIFMNTILKLLGIGPYGRKKKGLNILVYFHNLKYDYNILKKHLNIRSVCQSNGQIYSVIINYKGTLITLKDSYKLFSSKLSDFVDAFSLDEKYAKPEYTMYEKYNSENCVKAKVNKDKFIDYEYLYESKMETMDFEEFKKKVDNTLKKYIRTNKFYHMMYYKDYLKNDCELLKEGVEALREMGLQEFGIDMHSTLTISSFSMKIMQKMGVFHNIYKVKGKLREYIQKSVYGGKVAVKDNKPQFVRALIEALDARSLYPAAIERLSRECGVPAGPARKIEDFQKVVDAGYFYIGRFHCKDTGYYQQLPMFCSRRKGENIYTNTFDEEATLARYSVEDLEKFQRAKCTFIDGVYWSETNNSFSEVIKYIYQKRLEAPNKPLKTLYKLILNSAYGKTIQKPAQHTYSYITPGKEVDFLMQNHNLAIDAHLVGKKYEVKLNACEFDHCNYAHVGSAILAMSKRIMNEVLDLCNSNGIEVYYMDTDSMHIKDGNIEKLKKLFREEYKRELIGEQLGQFHSDFESRKISGPLKGYMGIYLDKKIYFEGMVNEKGEKDSHVRMKGVNKQALRAAAMVDKKEDYEQLFTRLYNGEAIKFNLLAYHKPSFDFNKGTVTSRVKFERLVQIGKYRKIYEEIRRVGILRDKVRRRKKKVLKQLKQASVLQL